MWKLQIKSALSQIKNVFISGYAEWTLRSVHDVTLQDFITFIWPKIMVMLMEIFYTGHTIFLQ